jgi:hypothetical protein
MYLLLRNNKQSGPYSLEELRSLGLKAYDLVWLEGKSAAWRYPSELEELKEFAPPVEEQPFDRFYKKPASVAATTVTTTISAAAKPATETSSVPGKRIIYVTMPAGRTSTATRETSRETAQEISRETAPAPSLAPGISDPAHAAYASGNGYARPIVEDISSQLPPLEEQLEQFSPRPTSRRRSDWRRSRRGGTRFLWPLAIGVCILALLAAGIFIGLSISRQSPSQPIERNLASKTPARNTESLVRPASQQLPVTAAGIPPQKKDSVGIIGQSSPVVPPVEKPAHAAKPKDKPKKAALSSVKKDSATGTSLTQREVVDRADMLEKPSAETKPENTVDKDAARIAIANQVSVGANHYNVGTFGGINNLQLTVTNRSDYPLDLVVVEVQYIQANKKVYKTENLYFRNMAAGSALMQEAPKSTRGIKVQYKITGIDSKRLGLTYSGDIR